MSTQRKGSYSKKKLRKKYIGSDTGTSSAEDSYFSSSLASSDDGESSGEEFDELKFKSKTKRKSRSYKQSAELETFKSRKSRDKYNYDDEEDHSIYRSNGKLSLQTISSLNNSRTILSALQSLQSKIQSLEEERDRYKNEVESYIREGSVEKDKRKEDRLLYLQEKEELMKERNHLSEQLIQSQERLNQLETQLSQFENHTTSLREDLRDAQVKLSGKDDRTMELSRKVIELEQEVERGKGREEQQSRKIEELSRFVVKERRTIERLEEQNSRLNASIQNLVELGKKKVVKKKGGAGGRGGKKKKVMNHGLKKRRRRVVNKQPQPITGDVFAWKDLPSTIKKKKRSRRKKKSVTRKKGTLFHTSKKGKSGRKTGVWSPGKGNLKERLIRANLKRNVPFIASGNPGSTFNTNSLAQTGLNMGITDKKKIRSIKKNDSTILDEAAGSDTTSTISTNPSCGLAEDVGRDHAESVLNDIKKEYDSLSLEYGDLLKRVKTGEEVKVTQKLKAVGELMKRKERQMEKLKSYHHAVNTSMGLFRPRVKGAKKRVKTLKLFRNLKKIVNT